MNTKYIRSLFIVASIGAYSGLVTAQPDDEADDQARDNTAEVVQEGQGPDSAVDTLALPESASDEAVEASAEGLATANEARERGREFGEDQAAEGRQRGEDAREEGAAMAADAREEAASNAAEAREQAKQNVEDNVEDNVPEDAQDRVPGS